ncbi:MAG TPA: FKBP-type peptidyl-prolyl cis-trans isomerase [Actinomycetes bacterium]|nr:FKBP-type peptidyl-prolyl cis-trans isomerase [Actinomycetes bacterium]
MRRAFRLRSQPRRLLAPLAVLCAMPLVLSACGNSDTPTAATTDTSTPVTSPSESESQSTSPSSTNAAGDLPVVEGDFGETPTVTVPDADPPTDLVVKTLHKGKGPAVKSGQAVVVNYLGARWDDGQTFDESFDRGEFGFGIGTNSVIAGWDQGLVGQTVGSRVLLVTPPDMAYGDTSPGDPIQAGDTLVFVVDIVAVHNGDETASGTITPTEDDGYPAVSVLPKKPEITVPPGKAPPKLVAIPVITGKGPKVKSGDTIVVQYVGKLWRNGKQFDASWDSGTPFVTQIGVGAVIPGWDQGLVGETVGSRVLLVVPSELGYGEKGSGQIKPGDDLVFAVDILAAY